MHRSPPPRPVPRRRAVLLAVLALLACGALLPPLVVETEPPPGDQLAVSPRLLRAGDTTTTLRVALGADAPAPLLVDARVTGVALSGDGVATPDGAQVDWATTSDATTPLRPGEALDLPVVVGAAPPDGLAAVVVRGVPAAEPRSNELVPDGEPVEVVALLLADGEAAAPRVALERDGGQVLVTVEVARPSLVGIAASARGTAREVTDRVAVPGRPTVVGLDLPSAPWPVLAEVVDDTGARATARLGPATLVLAVPAVLLLLAATALLVVALRRRGAAPEAS